jgi:hypothetical protein
MEHLDRLNSISSKLCDSIPLDDIDIHFLIYIATYEEKVLIFQKINTLLLHFREFILQIE